jgi:hypothetical protein
MGRGKYVADSPTRAPPRKSRVQVRNEQKISLNFAKVVTTANAWRAAETATHLRKGEVYIEDG